MKYVLNKDLPTFKAGTLATFNNWIFKSEDWKVIAHFSATDLATHPNILTEWFTSVEEKRKVVPVAPDEIYIISHTWYISVCKYWTSVGEGTIGQGNWRWTQEEAELEVKKRAAIERVRRYLVQNDLLEEDKNKPYFIFFTKWDIIFAGKVPGEDSYYSPYGRIKNTDLTQFLEDCREDLLIIHS